MKFIPYLLYLFLIAFYRVILIDFFTIGWIEIYLAALIVMLVALYKDGYTSLWFGFATGVVFDSWEPSHFGIHMIILTVMGVVTAQLKERFNLESLTSRVFLLLGGIFAYAIPRFIIYQHPATDEIMIYLLKGALPSVGYTVLVGWLFFMFQTRRVSYQKLKSLF